jgi:hypothetical protein
LTLAGRAHESPKARVSERLTGPLKPPTLVTVMTCVPVAPGASGPTVTAVEGLMVKSVKPTW